MCHREAIVDGRRGTERRRRGRLHDAMCAWEAFDCRGHAPSREVRERPEAISTVEPTRASPPRRGVPRSPRGSPSSSRVFARRASTNDLRARGGFGINQRWLVLHTRNSTLRRAARQRANFRPFRTFASAVFPGAAPSATRALRVPRRPSRDGGSRGSPLRSRGRGRWRRETRFHAGSAFRRAPRPSCRRQLSGDGFERTDGAPGTRRSRASRRGSRGGRRGRSIREPP